MKIGKNFWRFWKKIGKNMGKASLSYLRIRGRILRNFERTLRKVYCLTLTKKKISKIVMKFFHDFFKISQSFLYHFFKVLQNFTKLFQNFFIVQQCFPKIRAVFLLIYSGIFLLFHQKFLKWSLLYSYSFLIIFL